MTSVALYRHLDAEGVLLYVGISNDPAKRLSAHMRESHWARRIATVGIDWLPNVVIAAAAERAAIRDEGPLYNVNHMAIEPATGPFLCADLEALAREIERHCNDFGLKPTSVCQLGCKTRGIYQKITTGGDMQYGTAIRLREWMAADRKRRLAALMESAQ